MLRSRAVDNVARYRVLDYFWRENPVKIFEISNSQIQISATTDSLLLGGVQI